MKHVHVLNAVFGSALMATVAGCASCRGKFPLLEAGGVECTVCTAFHRLRNLVWGTRFPGELGGAATRTLHNCYLQLLQKADQFYFQQPAGGQILPGASKGGDLPIPGKEAKERKKRDKRRRTAVNAVTETNLLEGRKSASTKP